MSDEQQAPDAPDNKTAPNHRPSGGLGWISAALANPAQTIALVGVFLLGGVEGLDMLRGEPAATVDIDAEIARRESVEHQAEQIKQAEESARECLAAVQELETQIAEAAQDSQTRSDEQLAFTGEIAQYLERLANKLTKKPPETGPRLDEYVRKALMRGYRTREDR